MIWQQWLEGVGVGLGTTTQEAGIIISFIGTIALVFISLVATKGREAGKIGSIIAFLFIIFFTFIEWIPIFMGSVVAFISAFFIAYAFNVRILGQSA